MTDTSVNHHPDAADPAPPVLGGIRAHLILAFAFGAAVNLLFLSSPLYMTQLYGRVLNSRSVETLVSLSIALALALILMGAADAARGRLLSRAAGRVARRLIEAVTARALVEGRGGGGAAATLMDVPFTLFFLFVLFLLHPWLGLVATLGALAILGVIALGRLAEAARERRISEGTRRIERAGAELSQDRGEIRALGLAEGLAARLAAEQRGVAALRLASGDLSASLGAITRALRLAAHSAALATGAVLAIDGALLPSAMLAAAILAGRALGPIEALPGALRQARRARVAVANMSRLTAPGSVSFEPGPRRAAGAGIEARRLVVAPRGSTRPALRGLSFTVAPGEVISVAGARGAGKSMLLRCLAGAEEIRSGELRIAGRDLAGLSAPSIAGIVGWMPQDAPVYPGTLRENIARFHVGATDEAVLRAARRAGALEAIEQAPRGLDTMIGLGAEAPSPGLRQSISFARALYGDPALVLLDQPTAHLDAAGEVAALNAIRALKAEGVTVVVVSHKPVLATLADRIMLLRDGVIEVFEPREAVLTALRRQSLKTVATPAPSAAGSNPEEARA
jgi:ABC-type protease/lipase transport system fused ATPase/permease subunit